MAAFQERSYVFVLAESLAGLQYIPLGLGAVEIVVRSLGLSGKLNTCISIISTTISLHVVR